MGPGLVCIFIRLTGSLELPDDIEGTLGMLIDTSPDNIHYALLATFQFTVSYVATNMMLIATELGAITVNRDEPSGSIPLSPEIGGSTDMTASAASPAPQHAHPQKKRSRKGSGAKAKATAKSHAGQALAARGGQANLRKKVHAGSKVVLAPKIGKSLERKARRRCLFLVQNSRQLGVCLAHSTQ